MKYIAHRGNLHGPRPELENSPSYIDKAIDAGFYVEVDVWGHEGELWLGHDSPQYQVFTDFFVNRYDKLFCHCKNVEAISLLQEEISERYTPTMFFHHTDNYTMTNKGYVWCYPTKTPPRRDAFVVLPEIWLPLDNILLYCEHYGVVGVCSDYVGTLTHK